MGRASSQNGRCRSAFNFLKREPTGEETYKMLINKTNTSLTLMRWEGFQTYPSVNLTSITQTPTILLK